MKNKVTITKPTCSECQVCIIESNNTYSCKFGTFSQSIIAPKIPNICPLRQRRHRGKL